jgi:predicted Zn-dependent protease
MVGANSIGAAWFGGWRRRLAIAATAVLLAGCTPAAPPGGLSNVSTNLQEAGSSDAHAAIVVAYGGVYRDTELERLLSRIVARLINASDDPGRSYAITILNAAAVNAFALPEGLIYVTRGLLALANDSSEVAAVLAHEMAHITADHATERRNQALAAAILNDAVQGAVEDDPAATQAAVTTSQQTLAGFSRQQELEADLIGIGTVERAGYDPYAAARFLNTMNHYEAYRLSAEVRQDEQPAFLASHPANQDRINAAIATAQALGPPSQYTSDHDQYLSAIDGLVFGDDIDSGFIRGLNFYHPNLAIAFAVADGFVLDNAREAVLATGADGTALRFDSVNLVPGEDLTGYLRSGWINGLDTSSVRSLTVNGLPAAAASATAAGWYFRITVVRVGNATYRFIFANAANTATFDQSAAAIAGSFRRLTPQEVAALNPLRVEIVQAQAGATSQSLSQQMRGVDRPELLFSILNAIEPGASVAPGSQVKTIVD